MNEREQSLMRQALEKIESLEARLAEAKAGSEPIAVVGIGCRFPGGANGPDAFWRLLRDGRDAIGPIPADRWDADEYYSADADAAGKTNTRTGAFIQDVDKFDPAFFGIAPREAATLDPQQRILLETAWEALEHAAIAPERLAGTRTGVFVGIGQSEYAQLLRECGIESIGSYHLSGTHLNFAAGRIAYCLGLNGPAMAIDTACSSSLTAVHVACQSIRAGDCETALACGINLILSPEGCVTATKIRMLSADGRCKTFDARADGFARGEGCGVVVLKNLSAAQAAGDRIFAVILGSAANQDGASGGLTVPNIEAQKAVIRQALARAGVAPEQVDYIEAHGTGTALGDPIELRALSAVLCKSRAAERPLIVGSVKTNIGHQESASGIAGLIKTVLALHHGEIPPHLNFEQPNPHVEWSELNVSVPVGRMPMPATNGQSVAGVSAFGASGTNVHVVLGSVTGDKNSNNKSITSTITSTKERVDHDYEHEHEGEREGGRMPNLIVISARTEAGLRDAAKNYRAILDAKPLADIAYTAGVGRNHFAQRLALVGDSPGQMRERIDAYLAGKIGADDAPEGLFSGVVDPAAPIKIGFLFTGQGSQYAGMGRMLAANEPVFRESLERCEKILGGRLGMPLRQLLETPELIDRIEITQPALISLEWALAEQWRSWGIAPAAVLGHSAGEYAAAVVAGVMSIEEALGLVCERGRLMASLPEAGSMAAVMAGEAIVSPMLVGAVSFAAMNGPNQTVISGKPEAVQAALERLSARGIEVRPVNVSIAAHSPLVEPMLDEFSRFARGVTTHAPRIDWASPVTGGLIAAGEPLPNDYWRRNVRETVRFSDAASALARAGVNVWIEIGPTPTLTGMARGFIERGEWLPSLRRSREDCVQMAESLGRLYTLGCKIDWERVYANGARRRASLPTYPFERRRCWFAPPAKRRAQAQWAAPLIERVAKSPLVREVVCETPLDPAGLQFLADHRVGEESVWPAAATLEMALEAARGQLGEAAAELSDVIIQERLALAADRRAQCVLQPSDSGGIEFTLISIGANGGSHSTHASGQIRRAEYALETANTDIAEDASEWPAEVFYARLAGLGMNLGPDYQLVQRVWRRPGEAWAECGGGDAEDGTNRENEFVVAPNTLDACLQTFAAAWLDEADESLYLPFGFESVVIRGRASGAVSCHAVLRGSASAKSETLVGDIDVFDENKRCIAQIKGFSVKRAARTDCLYKPKWVEIAVQPYAPPEGGTTNGAAWLIWRDKGGIGERLAERLRLEGEQCVLASSIEEVANISAPRGVVYLAACDLEAGDLESARRLAGTTAMMLLQNLPNRIGEDFRGVWFVTRGAQAVGDEKNEKNDRLRLRARDGSGFDFDHDYEHEHEEEHGDSSQIVTPGQAMLWGLGRTVAIERPELRPHMVDLDPTEENGDAAEALLAELRRAETRTQTVIRGKKRFELKLEKMSADKAETLLELICATPGIIDGLKLVACERRVPAAGEVEVAMTAAGLNFRDVMIALNMIQGDAAMGVEFAGRVTATGSGVSGLSRGERVVGIAFGGAFRSRVISDARLVARIPDSITDAEAVTIPSAFMTAQEALIGTGKLKSGETILIHAAAGGVGLAAVALARKAGARILATAGSEVKREFLHSLGIEHVFDSRSPGFAVDVRRATDGRGVDLVLNSLAGELMRLSLELVAAGGRFLEIGKTGIYTSEQAAAINPRANHHVIDLVAQCRRDPERMQEMLAGLMARFESGELAPLPRKEFKFGKAADAFRFMAQARHIGKIVLVNEVRHDLETALREQDATYVISGGLGGLGLATAAWLVEKGARRIALIGRREASPPALDKIAEMREAGARIEVYQADVARFEEIENAFGRIESELGPVRGVIHAAGVIEDAVLASQTAESFARVLAPKVDGSWNLHRLTRETELDFFVMYSSAAAVLGSAGQGAYTAACAFEDALAWQRRAEGLPATSVDWGPWAEIGMTASRRVADQVRREGFVPFAPAEALELLGRIVDSGATQVVALRRSQPAVGSVQRAEHTPANKTTAEPAAQGRFESRSEIEQHISLQVRKVLGLEADQALPARQGFASLGMDSLMSVELRNRLQRSLARTLPTTLTFDYPTIEAMTDFIAGLFEARADSLEETVAAMSDEEAEAMLVSELNQLNNGTDQS